MFPLAPEGRREILRFGLPLILAAGALAWWAPMFAFVPALLFCFVIYFFRDPVRAIPSEARVFVSPADGTVTEIMEVDEPLFIKGKAMRIGIFLSVFNVHVNRAPEEGTVAFTRYQKGAFHNAMSPVSSAENESQFLGMNLADGTPVAVKQIAGLIARRIVFHPKEGDRLRRGEKYGMIKFGSRTELYWPASLAAKAAVKPGDRVRGGETVLARY